MAYFGPLGVLMPDQIQDISGQAHKVVAFGFVTGLGALVAVIANPLAGTLSDRTASRFGRRRPWTLGGALASAMALVLLAGQHTVMGVAVGWCLAQAGLNAMQAGIAASVPDRVPVTQRGAVSGWLGAPQCVGVVLAVFLVSKVATGSLGYLVLAILTVDRVHYSQVFPGRTAEDGLAILLLVYTAVVVVAAIVSGPLSDRGGWRRGPVMISGVVMAIPAAMLALSSAWPVVLVGAAILGLGSRL